MIHSDDEMIIENFIKQITLRALAISIWDIQERRERFEPAFVEDINPQFHAAFERIRPIDCYIAFIDWEQTNTYTTLRCF